MTRERTEQTRTPKREEALERALRASKPPVPPLPADFAAQVWAEVARQGLVPRPAWRVRGALWAGRAGAAALLALAVVTLNAAVYELRSNGSLEVLYFGARLLDGFLAAVPYDLVAATLLMGAGAAWLLRHARFARVPVAWALILAYGLTGTGGLALAATGFNDLVRDTVLGEEAPPEGEGATTPAAPAQLPGTVAGWVTAFFAERAVYHRPHARFRMGRVLSQEGNRVRLISPRGEELEAQVPAGFQARPGDHLRLIVDPNGGNHGGQAVLRADSVQHCAPGAQRYFHHPRMMRGMGPRGMGPGHMGPGMPGGMGRGMGMEPGHMGPGMGMGPRGMGFDPLPSAPEADAGR